MEGHRVLVMDSNEWYRRVDVPFDSFDKFPAANLTKVLKQIAFFEPWTLDGLLV